MALLSLVATAYMLDALPDAISTPGRLAGNCLFQDDKTVLLRWQGTALCSQSRFLGLLEFVGDADLDGPFQRASSTMTNSHSPHCLPVLPRKTYLQGRTLQSTALGLLLLTPRVELSALSEPSESSPHGPASAARENGVAERFAGRQPSRSARLGHRHAPARRHASSLHPRCLNPTLAGIRASRGYSWEIGFEEMLVNFLGRMAVARLKQNI